MIAELLFFILASSGVTVVISISSIFEPIRLFIQKRSSFLGELIACPMCTGFWSGLFISLISFDINPIYGGSIASLSGWVCVSLVDVMHSASNYFEASIEQGDEQ